RNRGLKRRSPRRPLRSIAAQSREATAHPTWPASMNSFIRRGRNVGNIAGRHESTNTRGTRDFAHADRVALDGANAKPITSCDAKMGFGAMRLNPSYGLPCPINPPDTCAG